MTTIKKAKSNCWTCKERKVGCDRALPTCGNCARARRACKAYGVKLAWPDKFDGRRKQKEWKSDPDQASATQYMTVGGDSREFVFLNTTFEDVRGCKMTWNELLSKENWRRGGMDTLARGLGGYHGVANGKAGLLGYYDSVVARMITTIDDDTNGFRLNLIPMALSSSDMSSRSLLEATLALASFHIGREEDALKHKVQAIKLLSDSFRSTTEQNRIAQFSTCMMLCVYSVFDSSDTTWNLHLQGAKSVIEAFSRLDRSDPSMAFMVHWLKYHDVFSVYSHRAEPSYTATDKNPELIMTLPESTAYNQQIIGLLGCSPELLGLISNINQLRTWLQTTNPPSARGAALPHLLRIRKRLLHLKQEILVRPGETSGAISHTRITLTAELYRIAALLYLFQVFALLPSTHTQIATLSSATTSQAHPSTLSSSPPSTSSSSAVWWNTSLVGSEDIANIVRQGLAVLDQLEICTSPWPLFIVACNVSDDADRIKMVGIIEAGGRARRVGNYQVVGSLVQAVWKRQDLAANERGEKGGLVVVDWRDLIEEGEMMPSFI